jgi:O-antigen/teichoic acid export membrane protein
MGDAGHVAARLVRNTLVNGLGGVATIAIGVVLTPFIIAQLGLAGYGIWTLALTLTFAGGYAALSDLGVEAATARYVAEALSDDDYEAVNRTVATTIVFFAGIGILLAGATIALSGPLTHLFSVPDAMRPSARLCFVLMGAQLVFELPSRAFVAVLEGAQRFTVYQAVELTRGLLQAALWTAALIAGYGVAALAAGLGVSTIVTLLLYWYFAHRAVPRLRARPRNASRAEFRRLVSFGSSVFVLRFAGTLYRQMDKLILGVALSPAAVGLYEIANKIHLMASTAQSMSVSALLPAAATSRREPKILRDLYLRGSCYTVAASLPVLLAAFAFAEPLVRDWIGSDAEGAAGPARLFLVYLLINVVHNVGSVMVVALGRLRVMLVITMTNVLINLVVSVALVHPLGIEGVILGTLVGNAAVWPWYLRLYLSVFDVAIGQWFRRIVLPNLPSIAVQGAILAALVALTADSGSLLVIALAIALSVVAYLATFVRFGLGAVERGVLLATLRSAVTGRTGPPAAETSATS